MEIKKENILISKCLCNKKCRYDAKITFNKSYDLLTKYFNLIEVCPETDGGLTCPRDPCEIKFTNLNLTNVNIKDFDIQTKEGISKKLEYSKGCEIARKLAIKNKVKYAILKEKSPSCGVNKVYDGSFTKTLINKNGLLFEYLKDLGIQIISSENLDSFLESYIKEKENNNK